MTDKGNDNKSPQGATVASERASRSYAASAHKLDKAAARLWPAWADNGEDDPIHLEKAFPRHAVQFPNFPQAGEREKLWEMFDWDAVNPPAELDRDTDSSISDDEHRFWILMTRRLREQGRRYWSRDEFNKAWIKWLDREMEREQAEIDLAKASVDRDARRAKAGRRATRQSVDALTISAGLGVSRRWAYQLLQNGTNNLETRQKLANVFSDDPSRSFAAAWQPKQGSWGRPTSPSSFKAYAQSMDGEFEGDEASAALAALRLAYPGSKLPAAFDDAGQLISVVLKAELEIEAVALAAAWKRFEFWRMLK